MTEVKNFKGVKNKADKPPKKITLNGNVGQLQCYPELSPNNYIFFTNVKIPVEKQIKLKKLIEFFLNN